MQQQTKRKRTRKPRTPSFRKKQALQQLSKKEMTPYLRKRPDPVYLVINACAIVLRKVDEIERLHESAMSFDEHRELIRPEVLKAKPDATDEELDDIAEQHCISIAHRCRAEWELLRTFLVRFTKPRPTSPFTSEALLKATELTKADTPRRCRELIQALEKAATYERDADYRQRNKHHPSHVKAAGKTLMSFRGFERGDEHYFSRWRDCVDEVLEALTKPEAERAYVNGIARCPKGPRSLAIWVASHLTGIGPHTLRGYIKSNALHKT